MEHAKKQLEEKIIALERELRDELPKALQKAIELGDLRENAEYHSAKDRQAYVTAELAQLRQRLAALSMIDLSKIPTDRVSYGSTVELYDIDNDTQVTYRLVSVEESDVNKGLISTTSPIGKSLMGKQEGDEVEIQTPRGIRNYEVLSFKTLHERSS